MNQAGLVALAVAGLWIAYLVPHHVRFRQQLLEARTDDRFSADLRVLRVARHPGTTSSRAGGTAAASAGPTGARPYLHPRRASRGGGSMHRPHGTADRITADAVRRTAAAHARRAASLARRRAAARRRALLTVVLLAATVGGWVAAAAGAALLLGAVPTVTLAAVLGLGRRAVLAGRRADAEWAAGAADRVPLPRGRDLTAVVGRAVHPSEATTELIARVPRAPRATRQAAARAGTRPTATASPASTSTSISTATSTSDDAVRPVARATAFARPGAAASAERAQPTEPTERTERTERGERGAAADDGWVPVPVPRPTYTLKPSAPRREPAPLVLDEPTGTGVAAVDGATDVGVPVAAGASVAAGAAAAGDDADALPTTAGFDLDAVLARRRAAGA